MRKSIFETIIHSDIKNDIKQKKKFDKEYNNFLLSEFILEKMEEKNISVRELARKAEVSPTIIQKLRNNKTADKINYQTFLSVVNSLGYRVNIERI